ncbi:MAG: 5-oxoprolinase (ATP-hydrolyzing) subunit [Pseudonocardiales bacterium]|jgi:UPF0271 protein|nr:5-oxoprolinase (ATP-hydrolyzing) subunit [Pseudonocardiales bacterium]MDQ1750718.1 5-oxoprolinase (ATP-hydrolyzing) subunit [Pseudonocardiales bacterium]
MTGAGTIDLNCDLGEGYGPWRMGEDDALLDIVTSANIACGFHAGDPAIMRRTVTSAAERAISIGAHVSYPDLQGFGRRHVERSVEELSADVLYQLGALDALAIAAGSRVAYVKPHGALYNEMAVDPELARTVVRAVLSYRDDLPLLCMPGSAAEDVARATGLPFYSEGFADRAYDGQGRLVSRKLPGAVLTDPAEVSSRAVGMAAGGTVRTTDGAELSLHIDTLCVHGDTPGSVVLARAVRSSLEQAGLQVRSFING